MKEFQFCKYLLLSSELQLLTIKMLKFPFLSKSQTIYVTFSKKCLKMFNFNILFLSKVYFCKKAYNFSNLFTIHHFILVWMLNKKINIQKFFHLICKQINNSKQNIIRVGAGKGWWYRLGMFCERLETGNRGRAIINICL